MNRKKKYVCLLALAAALACGGCGNKEPVQITIGDPAAAQQLENDVTLTSGLDESFTLVGNPPSKQMVYLLGRLTDNRTAPSTQQRVMGLSGSFIHVTATADGFRLAGDDGTDLYEETGYQGATNFKFYRLSTSDPNLRLWVVSGPDVYPYLVWVLGEKPDGITCYASPDDFVKAGISIQDPGKERLSLKVEDGVLSVTKLHMEKMQPVKPAAEGGKFEPAKVEWKEDKAAALLWSDKDKKFALGSVPGKKSSSFLDSLFGSKGSVKENNILEIDDKVKPESVPMENGNGATAVLLPTSNGKNMRLLRYRDFFRITSEDGSVVYYTSEPQIYDGGRFRLAEVKVSDPDTRVWSLYYQVSGTTGMDYGYWLIGDYKGVLKIFLTPEDMARAGVPPVSRNFMEGERTHKLGLRVEDGVIKVDMSHEFWPYGRPHTAALWLLDHTFTIGWDKDAQNFMIKDVAVPEVPTKRVWNKDTKSHSWQALTEDEQKWLAFEEKMARTQM